MKAYKLTDENNRTRNSTQWGENVTHEAMGNGKKLCTDGWIHFYEDPLVAMMMNPIHASFHNPHLWEAEVEGEMLREATKSGCKKLTTLKQIPLPEITLTQRVAFGILCALEVCAEESFREWAKNWLSGKDRSVCAAYAAHTAAYSYAAHATGAAYAAYAAAVYAAKKYAANIAYATIANNVAYAAASSDNSNINLPAIVKKAMTYK